LGFGYELLCTNCGFNQGIHLGIGFRYPQQCADILRKIKDGKYGKCFAEAAESTPNAAVHFSNELFICDSCGSWLSDTAVDLCAPISEAPNRTGRFCAANSSAQTHPYVLKHEIGHLYRVVKSKPHTCSKCKYSLRPATSADKLICPECGGILIKGCEINWD